MGDIDEEAIPEADLPGEAVVGVGKTVTKTIRLTPGAYVMFCNIDTTLPDGTVISHFQRGMTRCSRSADERAGSLDPFPPWTVRSVR